MYDCMWLFCFISVRHAFTMPAYFTFLLKFRVWCSEKQNLPVPVIPRTSERMKLRSANIWLKAFQFCIYAAHQREQHVIQDVCCSGCYGKRGVHSPLPATHPTPKWQLGDHTNVNSKSPEDGTSSNDTTEGGGTTNTNMNEQREATVFSLINNAQSGLPFLISISVLPKPSLCFWPTVILAYSAKTGPQSSTLYLSSTHRRPCPGTRRVHAN